MDHFYKNIPLKIYQDFPIGGVGFIDIFPLLNQGILDTVGKDLGISSPVIFLPEARAFCLFHALKKSDNYLIPLRKKGKLPGPLQEVSYVKEYGADHLYFSKDHLLDSIEFLGKAGALDKYNDDKVIPVAIVDDVLATGGTAYSLAEAINNISIDGCPYRFHVEKTAFLIEIPFLKGRQLLMDRCGVEVSSLIESD